MPTSEELSAVTLGAFQYEMSDWNGARPITCEAFGRAVYGVASDNGGRFPKVWHLPRDVAEELAGSMAEHFKVVGAFSMDGTPTEPPTAEKLFDGMVAATTQIIGVFVRTTPAIDVAEGPMRAALPELRPPPERAGKPGNHWLEIDHGGGRCEQRLARWEVGSGGFWCLPGLQGAIFPARMAELGWRYLGPAKWLDRSLLVAEPQPDGSMRTVSLRTDREAEVDRARIAELEAEVASLRQRDGKRYTPTGPNTVRIEDVAGDPPTHGTPLPAKAMR